MSWCPHNPLGCNICFPKETVADRIPIGSHWIRYDVFNVTPSDVTYTFEATEHITVRAVRDAQVGGLWHRQGFMPEDPKPRVYTRVEFETYFEPYDKGVTRGED